MPLVAKVRVAMNEVARTDDLAERSLAALATYAEERRQDKIISESRFLRGVLETQMSKIQDRTAGCTACWTIVRTGDKGLG